jgi:hypothetical protein
MFDEFWTLYPRKIDKKKSQEKYNKAIKDWVSHGLIIDWVKRYAEYCKSIDTHYIKHPSTRLNAWWRDSDYTVKVVSTQWPSNKLQDSHSKDYTAWFTP